MRQTTLIAALACFLATGCLYGRSQGQTTTAYVNDDGVHPVQRTTVTQTASGSTIGASLPLMMGGAMIGDQYGGATIVGGGYGVGGGGNPACVLHPDMCAVVQTAVVYQPVSITSVGGGYGTMGVSGVGGGQTTMVGPGGSGTYAETDDSAELSAMLAKHEKAISILVGQARVTTHRVCEIVVANPEAIKDKGERDEMVRTCNELLSAESSKDGKKPHLAPAKGEEK